MTRISSGIRKSSSLGFNKHLEALAKKKKDRSNFIYSRNQLVNIHTSQTMADLISYFNRIEPLR